MSCKSCLYAINFSNYYYYSTKMAYIEFNYYAHSQNFLILIEQSLEVYHLTKHAEDLIIW